MVFPPELALKTAVPSACTPFVCVSTPKTRRVMPTLSRIVCVVCVCHWIRPRIFHLRTLTERPTRWLIADPTIGANIVFGLAVPAPPPGTIMKDGSCTVPVQSDDTAVMSTAVLFES